MIHFISVTPAGPISSTQVIGLRGALKIPPPPTISQLQDILPRPNKAPHPGEQQYTPTPTQSPNPYLRIFLYHIYNIYIIFAHLKYPLP